MYYTWILIYTSCHLFKSSFLMSYLYLPYQYFVCNNISTSCNNYNTRCNIRFISHTCANKKFLKKGDYNNNTSALKVIYIKIQTSKGNLFLFTFFYIYSMLYMWQIQLMQKYSYAHTMYQMLTSPSKMCSSQDNIRFLQLVCVFIRDVTFISILHYTRKLDQV